MPTPFVTPRLAAAICGVIEAGPVIPGPAGGMAAGAAAPTATLRSPIMAGLGGVGPAGGITIGVAAGIAAGAIVTGRAAGALPTGAQAGAGATPTSQNMTTAIPPMSPNTITDIRITAPPARPIGTATLTSIPILWPAPAAWSSTRR